MSPIQTGAVNYEYLTSEVEVGRLTDTDPDIAIFKKPKPTPTRYLEKPKKPTIEK